MKKTNRYSPEGKRRTIASLLLGASGLVCSAMGEGAGNALRFSGVGWVQYGQIGNSSDTSQNNYNGNAAQNSGAQISVIAQVTDALVGAVGLGVFEGHPLAGQLSGGGRSVVGSSPYISEARFTYSRGSMERPGLQVTGGLFSYIYNPNVKDLGLYLLRGTVYPGFLSSGFETKDVLPIANTLGVLVRNQVGPFRSDVLLISETEFKPYFDGSLVWIGQLDVSNFLTLGAGVNFHRLIPRDEKDSHNPFNPIEEESGAITNPYRRKWIYVEGTDTTFFGFDGTKVGGNFALDLKPLLGLEALGREDLTFYGEAAVIGLNFDRGHKAIYGGLANRMPIMLGMNLPCMGWLDHVSLEVEHYGAKFSNDIRRLVRDNDWQASPIPYSQSDSLVAFTRDDWKWAVHAAKTIKGHFKVSGQVANDHFRPGGTVASSSYETAFTTPKDWYWMAKIAYFF